MGSEELNLDELLEKIKKLGLDEEEALSIVKATILLLSMREKNEFTSKLMKKYGIEVPF